VGKNEARLRTAGEKKIPEKKEGMESKGEKWEVMS